METISSEETRREEHQQRPETKKPPEGGFLIDLLKPAACHVERDKRLELSTYTLARYRSTN
jgi:hypothetical protein